MRRLREGLPAGPAGLSATTMRDKVPRRSGDRTISARRRAGRSPDEGVGDRRTISAGRCRTKSRRGVGRSDQIQLRSIGWVASAAIGIGWRRSTRDPSPRGAAPIRRTARRTSTIQSSRSICPRELPDGPPQNSRRDPTPHGDRRQFRIRVRVDHDDPAGHSVARQTLRVHPDPQDARDTAPHRV